MVTAHNRDDQAETVLYRLVKYAAPSSLRAMRPREGGLARPLLCLGAAELRAYCRELGIVYGEDETNSTVDYRATWCATGAAGAADHQPAGLPRRSPKRRRWQTRSTPCSRRPSTGPGSASPGPMPARPSTRSPRPPRPSPRPPDRRAAARKPSWALDVRRSAAEPAALRALCLRRLRARALGDEALHQAPPHAGPRAARGRTAGSRRSPWAAATRRCASTSCSRCGAGRARTRARPPRPHARVVDSFLRAALPRRARRRRRFEKTTAEAWLSVGRPDREVVLRHPRRGDRLRPFGMTTEVLLSDLLGAPAGWRAPAAAMRRGGRTGRRLAWVCPGRSSEWFRVTSATPYTLHIFEEATEAT